jgi:nucleotide-binding universal stress UspA family protein
VVAVAEQHAQRIVVGIDGSELSAQALLWAVRQSRFTGAEVVAVTAWEVSPLIYLAPTSTEADYERDAVLVLDRVVAQVQAEHPDVPIAKALVEGRAGIALSKAATGATLLVVGSHGRKEFPRMHIGSVAGYCVHHAPCPVLVFRGPHSED